MKNSTLVIIMSVLGMPVLQAMEPEHIVPPKPDVELHELHKKRGAAQVSGNVAVDSAAQKNGTPVRKHINRPLLYVAIPEPDYQNKHSVPAVNGASKITSAPASWYLYHHTSR